MSCKFETYDHTSVNATLLVYVVFYDNRDTIVA